MALNKKEEEILKQIELELSKEDPDLAKTVETSTLSSFSRTRSVISFGTFVLGLLTMLGSYIVQPIIAMVGFGLLVAHAGSGCHSGRGIWHPVDGCEAWSRAGIIPTQGDHLLVCANMRHGRSLMDRFRSGLNTHEWAVTPAVCPHLCNAAALTGVIFQQ